MLNSHSCYLSNIFLKRCCLANFAPRYVYGRGQQRCGLLRRRWQICRWIRTQISIKSSHFKRRWRLFFAKHLTLTKAIRIIALSSTRFNPSISYVFSIFKFDFYFNLFEPDFLRLFNFSFSSRVAMSLVIRFKVLILKAVYGLFLNRFRIKAQSLYSIFFFKFNY